MLKPGIYNNSTYALQYRKGIIKNFGILVGNGTPALQKEVGKNIITTREILPLTSLTSLKVLI